MPQLSVELDDNMIDQIRENAKVHNISVSKFISNALDKYMSNQWPEFFEALFGSVQDESFQRQPQIPFQLNAKNKKVTQVKKPEISPDFTIEDIHKIREYDAERRKVIGEEAYWAEVQADSLYIQGKIQEAREKSLSKENDSVGKAVK
jgi:hypothetical protein